MRDSLLRGEAPFAGHLLYAQIGILDDTLHIERELGIAAHIAWGKLADLVAVYKDLGISSGMVRGIEAAETAGLPIEYRTLGEQKMIELLKAVTHER
jgi:hypothetical protein